MKYELGNQFGDEIWADVGVKVDLSLSKSQSNSDWGQQRPQTVTKKLLGRSQLKQRDDTIEAGRQAVRWFRSWRTAIVIVPLAQSGRCPIPDAGVRYGSARDTGSLHFASPSRRTELVDRDTQTSMIQRIVPGARSCLGCEEATVLARHLRCLRRIETLR